MSVLKRHLLTSNFQTNMFNACSFFSRPLRVLLAEIKELSR